MTEDTSEKTINAQEERELRRVYDHLAGYHCRRRLHLAIDKAQEQVQYLSVQLNQKKSEKNNGQSWSSKEKGETIDKGKESHENEEGIAKTMLEEQKQQLEMDIEKKKQEIQTVQNNSTIAISSEDLYDGIKALGKKCTKKEIERMIWEGDENLDGRIDWHELRTLVNRNLTDKTELEPNTLFHVVQFMTYDKKLCGTITADNTMALLFARYGRAQLEIKMKELFGTKEELSFDEYLQCVNKKNDLQKKRNDAKTK